MRFISTRRAVRLAVAGLFLVVLGGGAAAVADTPATWEDAPGESFSSYAIVLFVIPIGLFVLISVLAVLPSLVRGNRGSSGTALVPATDRDRVPERD